MRFISFSVRRRTDAKLIRALDDFTQYEDVVAAICGLNYGYVVRAIHSVRRRADSYL